LDKEIMFEWQRASQGEKATPHYDDLLKFIDLRAQVSETSSNEPKRQYVPKRPFIKHSTTLMANVTDAEAHCPLCTDVKHPLYA